MESSLKATEACVDNLILRRSQSTMSDAEKRVWDSLLNVSKEHPKDWSPSNPWRPLRNKWEWAWRLLFFSKHFNEESFDNMRELLLWMWDEGIINQSKLERHSIIKWKSVKNQHRWWPTPPKPVPVTSEQWRLAMQNGNRRLQWKAQFTFEKYVDSVAGDELIRRLQQAVGVAGSYRREHRRWWHNCMVDHIVYSMLIPGFAARLREGGSSADSLRDGWKMRCQRLEQTPGYQRYRVITEGRFCVVRGGEDGLWLIQGRIYKYTGNRLGFITSLRMCQERNYENWRDNLEESEECRSVDPLNINHRRPFWVVRWREFELLNDSGLEWWKCQSAFDKCVWVTLTDSIMTVNTGECASRYAGSSEKGDEEVHPLDIWDDWFELNGIDLNWRQLRCRHNREADPVPLTPNMRESMQATYQKADMRCEECQDPDRMILGLTVGYDSFLATQFASANRSLTGMYYRWNNLGSLSMPWQTWAVIRESIQLWCVMKEMWTDVRVLLCRNTTVAQCPFEGSVRLTNVHFSVLPTAVALDKAEMDTLWGNRKSNPRNRTEAMWYRGGLDPLELPADFHSCDARYMKDWKWWVDSRERFSRRCADKKHRDLIFKLEGWTNESRWKWWTPQWGCISMFALGRLDTWHVLDTLIQLVLQQVRDKYKGEDWDIRREVWLAAENWARMNHESTDPSLESGFTGGGLTMVRSAQRAMQTYVALRGILPEDTHVAVLGALLDILVRVQTVQSGPEVHELQARVKWVLQVVSDHMSEGFQSLNRPKLRMLVTIAFWQCPLWRNVGVNASLNVEKHHQRGKMVLGQHSNNRDTELERISDMDRRRMGLEFVLAGGCFGPRLQYRVDRCVQQLASPLDPCRKLLRGGAQSAFEWDWKTSLRMDQVRGEELSMDYWREFLSGLLSQERWGMMQNMLRQCNFVGLLPGMDTLLRDRSQWQLMHVTRARWENGVARDEWSMSDGRRQFLVCKDSTNVKWLLECDSIFRLVRKKSDGGWIDLKDQWDRERVIFVCFGWLFRLERDVRWKENRRDFDQNKSHHYRLQLHRGFQACVPGSSIEGTAMIQHLHNEKCGVCGDRWRCDLDDRSWFECWDHRYLWLPQMWKRVSRVTAVPNVERRWNPCES